MITPAPVAFALALCLAAPVAAAGTHRADPGGTWDDIWWWQEPATGPAAGAVVPSGVYYVTEVYVSSVVSSSGPLTTYATVTAQDSPGTYARVADVVATGAASIFDGVAFNGRASLTDGRSVAGTYYENFVLRGGAFVPVGVVFFQDDSILADRAAPVRSPEPVAAVPPPLMAPPRLAVPSPRAPVIRPGVAGSPLADPGAAIEVLRGRAIRLWIRATVDGVPVDVSSWRVAGGEHVALSSAAGGPDDAFVARWDEVTPPRGTWSLGLEITVAIDGGAHTATGEIAVLVRSPALVR